MGRSQDVAFFGRGPLLGGSKQCKFMVIWRDFPYNNAWFGSGGWKNTPVFSGGDCYYCWFEFECFVFFFLGGGGKYSLSFIHYTCHSGFHFTQTSQGKTLKDGRIHGILLHHIRFKSVLGGILFGGSISKSSPCHNKLTTPPGFSPPALLSLGLKNQKKPTGLDGVGFFPKAQNV